MIDRRPGERLPFAGTTGKRINRWNKALRIVDIAPMDRMAAFSREQLTAFLRGISARQVRLASGLVLFAYLLSHFLNHALGNVSMEALASGVYYHTLFWQFLPITILFYTACLVHTSLGIWALYERRQFRWKAIEPLQLVLGLSVPALVIAHIIGVRLGQTLYGHESSIRKCCSCTGCGHRRKSG